MVRKSILKHKKKFILPTAVLSTTFLSSIFSQIEVMAKDAKPKSENFFNWLFLQNKNIGELDGNKFGEGWTHFITTWTSIGDGINNIMNFFANFKENMAQLSIDFLTHIYELMSTVVLQTPLLLFNTPQMQNAHITFSFISIFIVTILTMFQAIKKMIRKKHTDFKSIIKRYAVVVTASGFAPFLFTRGFAMLNNLTQAIIKIGALGIQPSTIGSFMAFTSLNTAILIIFDLAVLALMIPLFLQNGRRWFDIMSLSLLTPLSLSAWIFDETRHLFHRWWGNLKRLGFVQLIYAIFLTIMTLFIFSTKYITNSEGLFLKLIIITGGLWRMLNPPDIVGNYERGKDIVGMGKDFKNTFLRTKNTLKGKEINTGKIKNYINYVKNYDKENKNNEDEK